MSISIGVQVLGLTSGKIESVAQNIASSIKNIYSMQIKVQRHKSTSSYLYNIHSCRNNFACKV